MKSIPKYALINALATSTYIVIVSSFMYIIQNSSLRNRPDTLLAPIFMLLLFVFSAALTGILVFGRPIIWYLDGKRRESLLLISQTLAFLFLIVVFLFISLLTFS
jgi:hypothetical protein